MGKRTRRLVISIFALMLTTSVQAAPIDVREQVDVIHSQKADSLKNGQYDIVRMSAGPGWIVSEVETYAGVYKRKVGFSASADYQHIWKNGVGVGVNYMYYTTSFKEGFDVNIHYIGPSFVGSLNLGRRCRWDTALGAGYANYRESATVRNYGEVSDISECQGHFGSVIQTCIEYRVTKVLAVGLKINGFVMGLKKPNWYTNKKYDFYGIKRFDALLGVSIYF